MTKWINEAGWDRALRVLGGALLLFLAFTQVGGVLQIVFAVIGVLLLVTGAVGICPAYYLVGVNTCRPGKSGV